MATRELRQKATTLRALATASRSLRRSMIANADKQLVLTLVKAAREIIKGEIQLTPAQLRRLRPHERSLGDFISSKSVKSRKKILQKGGFLGVLIGPLLKLATGALLNGLGGGKR